jgi:hypothetical protein
MGGCKVPSPISSGEPTMDFIERLFGIAPDGGSGTLEMALFLIPLAGLVLLWYVRQRKAR